MKASMQNQQAQPPPQVVAHVESAFDRFKLYVGGGILALIFGVVVFFLQRELTSYDETKKETRAAIIDIRIGLKAVDALNDQYKLQQKFNEDNNRRLEEAVKDINRRMEARPLPAPSK